MSIINVYGNPVITNWEIDDNGNKISVPIKNEKKQVTGNKIVLEGLPDEQYRVFIDGFVEIDIKDKITETNQFKVDYRKNGVIFVHESLDGQWLTVGCYYSVGMYYIPASRVWTKIDDFGNVVETLDSVLQVLEGALDLSNQIQQAENTRIQNEAIRQQQEQDRQTNITNTINSINNINRAFEVWEDYDNTKDYVPLNKVVYQGSSFVNKVACKGILPTDTNNWQLVALKGADGGGAGGAGDMLKNVYDINNNGIVDKAEDANTVNGKTVEENVPANAKFTDTITEVVDDLSTDDATKALSARQGMQLFQYVSNGKNLIATAITDKGVATQGSDAFTTMANNIQLIETDKTGDATAISSDIILGKTAYAKGTKLTGTMPNRGSINQSLPINGSYTIPEGYHSGLGKVTQSITTKGTQTFTPGVTNQTISANQYLTGVQTILGSANLKAENIKSGVNIFGIIGNLVAGNNMKEYAFGTTTYSNTIRCVVTGLSFIPKFIAVYTMPESSPYIGIYSQGNSGFPNMNLIISTSGTNWVDQFTDIAEGTFTARTLSYVTPKSLYWLALA